MRTNTTVVSLMIVLSFAAVPACFSQSTDFSRPTPLTSVPLTGEHDCMMNAANYYSFNAGPGNFLVTFDGHTPMYATTAALKFYDVHRTPIGEINLVAKDTPASESKTFKLSKATRVVMEIDLPKDPSTKQLKYSVNMTGAVSFNSAPANTTSAGGSGPSFAPSRGGSGRLHIEMKDGSSKDFEMANVRRIVVE